MPHFSEESFIAGQHLRRKAHFSQQKLWLFSRLWRYMGKHWKWGKISADIKAKCSFSGEQSLGLNAMVWEDRTSFFRFLKKIPVSSALDTFILKMQISFFTSRCFFSETWSQHSHKLSSGLYISSKPYSKDGFLSRWYHRRSGTCEGWWLESWELWLGAGPGVLGSGSSGVVGTEFCLTIYSSVEHTEL